MVLCCCHFLELDPWVGCLLEKGSRISPHIAGSRQPSLGQPEKVESARALNYLGYALGPLAEKAKTLMVSSADSHSLLGPGETGGRASSLTAPFDPSFPFLSYVPLSRPPCLLPCPHCLSSLPSLTTVLLGFFLTFSFNVLTSLSPLLSRPGPALLCVSQCLRFWLFSLSFLPTEQTEAREVTPSHVPGGKRGDFHTFLSLSELDHCHCKMGRQAIAPGCTSEAGPGSRQESSCILCPRTVLEVVEAWEPGRTVRGLAKALGSRPCVLCCTALSSLTSPSEHTASSHTSKVKCGCFNH